MTTATQSVAVVATRLPNTDRRALSQAWYSALHLTQTQAQTPAAKPSRTAPLASTSVRAKQPAPPLAARPTPVCATGRLQRSVQTPPAAERRGSATDLSRRMERALLQHGVHVAVRPATLTIQAGAGRVQLIVRTDGAVTRIVALCAPDLRDRVDRALARARFALAANGARVEVTAR